jgi:tRNA G46 methylase TrmB
MIDWLVRVPGLRKLSSFRTILAAHWFDWRHQVNTCGEEDPRELSVVGENASHAIPYIPTTPRSGRYMLRDLPVADVSNHTFIDIGSGKGRMLLLAAELPFRRIIGVEFASDLDALARRNVKTYRNRNKRASRSNRSTWTLRNLNFQLNRYASICSIRSGRSSWTR